MKKIKITVSKTTSGVQGIIDFCKSQNVQLFEKSELHQDEQIGFGSFGKCFKAHFKDNNSVVALKMPKQDVEPALYRKEVKLLNSLSHPNVVTLVGIVHSQTDYGLAMEFMEFHIQEAFDLGNVDIGDSKCHSLADLLGLCRRLDIQHDIANSGLHNTIALQSAEGLAYLHENNVTHRDLKTDNILIRNSVDKIISCKLCDFGEARSTMLKTRTIMTTRVQRRGTLVYNSPEQLSREIQEDINDLKKSDVWAMGMVFFCLLNPSVIYPWMTDLEGATDAQACLSSLMEDEKLPSPNEVDRSMVKLEVLGEVYRCCARHNAKDRYVSSDVVRHLW